jgi:hypothetical protein
MYGKGILKGLSVTWKRFWDTYIEDISWLLRGKKRYYTEEGIKHRSSSNTKGIFNQYPEERLIALKRGFVPFLVYLARWNERTALHVVWHLREGLPAAMYLDRAFERPEYRPSNPRADRVLHRCGYLHELWLLRGILPVRRDHHGS